MTWAASIIGNVSENATLRRVSAGSYDASGVWREGVVSETTISGSMQPASQRDLEELPEGRRISEGMKLYTAAPLFTALSSEEKNADIIAYDGKEYEVVSVRNWKKTTQFYRA